MLRCRWTSCPLGVARVATERARERRTKNLVKDDIWKDEENERDVKEGNENESDLKKEKTARSEREQRDHEDATKLP
jgi:hypothetical protein